MPLINIDFSSLFPSKSKEKSETKNKKKTESDIVSFAPPADEEALVAIRQNDMSSMPGESDINYVVLDFERRAKTLHDMIMKYRRMSMNYNIDDAIDEVVNDAIVIEDGNEISLDLNSTDFSKNIRDKIYEEWNQVLNVLNYKNKGQEIFRRFYIDGRINYHIIIDQENLNKGVLGIRYIEPMNIKKIVEYEEIETENKQIVNRVKDEFYFYKRTVQSAFDQYSSYESMNFKNTNMLGIKVHKDFIAEANFDQFDYDRKLYVGPLERAIKPNNQLSILEDAIVVYRVARAPERRAFYIDVGRLTKNRAEEYLRSIMNKFKTKIVYDSNQGTIENDQHTLSMMEDYWLPRTEGGRGTEISTVGGGGQNLSDIDDIMYFKNKLYKALKIPSTRIDNEDQFSLGRPDSLSRSELKFYNYINSIRRNFSSIFIQILKVQLITKKIITEEEWTKNKNYISVVFPDNNLFTEFKKLEILETRLNTASSLTEQRGLYYSHDWIRKEVLGQTEEQITKIDKQIKDEKKDERYKSSEEDNSGGRRF